MVAYTSSSRAQKQNLDRVLQALSRTELSTIPAMMTRLLSVSRDPRSHASDLASLCEMDKATSARLLRAANSVYFATQNRDRVDSIKDAIVRIGFGVAEEIILSSTVSSVLRTNTTIADYSSAALWKHSIAVAIGSRLIYNSLFVRSPIDPFIAGLLHDIGIAIEHQFLFEDGFKTAVIRRAENQTLLAEEERESMGLSHEEVGEAVATKWNFPDHLVTVIGNHHKAVSADEPYAAIVHVVRLADYVAFKLQHGYSDFSEQQAEDLLMSKDALGLRDEVFNTIMNQVSSEMASLLNLGWFSELRLKLR